MSKKSKKEKQKKKFFEKKEKRDAEAYDIANENVKIKAKKLMKENPNMKIDVILDIAAKGMVEKAENIAAALTGVEDAVNDKKLIKELKRIKKESSKN